MVRILSFFLLAAGPVVCQPLAGLRDSLVTVQNGSGVVVARSGNRVLIVTAGHVLAEGREHKPVEPGQEFEGSLGKMMLLESACDVDKDECPSLRPKGESCRGQKGTRESPCGPMDLALLVAMRDSSPRDTALSGRGTLKVGNKLGIGGFLKTSTEGAEDLGRAGRVKPAEGRFPLFTEPNGDVVLFKEDSPAFQYTARFGITPAGVSGGAVYDARGRLRGIQSKAADEDIGLQTATRWDIAEHWMIAALNRYQGPGLDQQTKESFLRHRIRPRSDSVTAVDRGETEIAATLQAIVLPGADPATDPATTRISPGLRIARPLPIYHGILLTGDVAFSGASKPLEENQPINREIILAGIGAQLQAGQHWGVLRRNRWLGGIYLGGGLGYLSVTRRIQTSGGAPMSTQSWVPFTDAGWRLRMPHRAWGIQAGYREVFSSPASALPGRIHMVSAGAFVVLK